MGQRAPQRPGGPPVFTLKFQRDPSQDNRDLGFTKELILEVIAKSP